MSVRRNRLTNAKRDEEFGNEIRVGTSKKNRVF
jgi:hypothetical protein